MSSNHNKAPNKGSLKLKTLAAVSALAIAAGGGAAEASASTHQAYRPIGSAEKNPRTPLKALTDVIAGLDKGEIAEVTVKDVVVPGPVGNAEARPIVFKEGGH